MSDLCSDDSCVLESEHAGPCQYGPKPDKPAAKPPIGLRPEFIWRELRIEEILEAMERYCEAKMTVPPIWIEELRDHMKWKKTGRRGTNLNGYPK